MDGALTRREGPRGTGGATLGTETAATGAHTGGILSHGQRNGEGWQQFGRDCPGQEPYFRDTVREVFDERRR